MSIDTDQKQYCVIDVICSKLDEVAVTCISLVARQPNAKVFKYQEPIAAIPDLIPEALF